MTAVDIILVLLIAAFVVHGSRLGLIGALGELISSLVGFFAARYGTAWLASYFLMLAPGRTTLARLVAFVLIFVLVERLTWLIFKAASSILSIITRLPFISSLDSLIGAIIGFVEGTILLGAGIYLVINYRVQAQLIAWLSASRVAAFVQGVFHSVLGYFV